MMKNLINEVRELLGADYEVESRLVEKANGTRLQGIVIGKKGDKIRPTIYVNDNMTAKEVAEIFNNNKGDDIMSINTDNLTNKEYILANVVPVVYNRKASNNILAECVHVPVADLEVAFRVIVNSVNNNMASYLVKPDVLSVAGITEQELYDTAIANIQGKGKVCDIMTMLLGMVNEVNELPEDANIPMVVITCDNKMYGASMIFDKGVREKLEKIFGEYYILPSSIHELIAIPKDGDVNDFVNMVKEVNATQLAPSDFLSDNVYVYTDKLEVA